MRKKEAINVDVGRGLDSGINDLYKEVSLCRLVVLNFNIVTMLMKLVS